ncbi:Haloalkane dehalogenase [Polystyrenella longa]|uniref:Haloalkane dehalogenase n=1 Tax=Polystyrenella longa TaxID=2528007 RepID=A0A518CN00_9PLAN|nr:alpha/beta fold hydrolase [Polystyrenella longa]QDU80606.1 Haloalkane dehalogenase [Polystyrenella longa]
MTSPNRDGFEEEYPFESHYFERQGHRLHYIDEGEGEVLLFVHGNPTWSFAWRNLVKDLSSNYRCIAIDHLGCGFSDKPQDYSYRLNDHIENLTALIEHLDLKQITFIAHDWGGAIAMGTAGRSPDRSARFVLGNTAAFRSQLIPRSIHLIHIPGFGAVAVRGFNAFVRYGLHWTVVDKNVLTPAIRSGYLAPYGNWHDRVAVLRFVQDIPLKPSHPSYETLKGVEEGLAQFKDYPMQFIWGEDDFCFTTKFLDEFQKYFPGANTLSFPDAGHYVFEDKPQEMIATIRQFLSSNPLK